MITTPIHPIFVHFTIGLFGAYVLLTIVSCFWPKTKLNQELVISRKWCLWLGMGFTIFTITTGFWSFFTVIHSEASHEIMVDHRNWALATFFLFGILMLGSIIRCFKFRNSKILALNLSIIAGFLLLVTGYLGGKLVYEYRVGVSSDVLKEKPLIEHSH